MVKLIKNEQEYDVAVERVYELMQMDLVDESPESDELDALALFVEDYERRNYPIAPLDPIDAIIFRLEQLGLQKKELAKILGTRARQSEILSGERKLHAELGVSAESLIAVY